MQNDEMIWQVITKRTLLHWSPQGASVRIVTGSADGRALTPDLPPSR